MDRPPIQDADEPEDRPSFCELWHGLLAALPCHSSFSWIDELEYLKLLPPINKPVHPKKVNCRRENRFCLSCLETCQIDVRYSTSCLFSIDYNGQP
ncbi:hypothetical protein KM043_017004 [Ampulex compressa]|nr:hypothetical protein KM043_017004 [Ampulex compressa]